MEQCTTTVTLFGAGYSAAPPPGSVAPQPDKHVVARVALGDPGYLATSQIFVQVGAVPKGAHVHRGGWGGGQLYLSCSANGAAHHTHSTLAPRAAAPPLQAALTLLQERGSIAAQLGGGGVFTVGAMFRDTRLIQRLSDNGVAFEVVAQ